jgi:hypothetical protein
MLNIASQPYNDLTMVQYIYIKLESENYLITDKNTT